MSSLVISSKYVEVDSKGNGIVTLKNVRNNSQGPPHTILFKVKTNLKDSVNVRPGYGLIPSSISKDTTHIKVNYTGGDIELVKAKLMITWIAIQKIIDDNKIPHDEFKQLFQNQLRVSEGTTLMPFNDISKNHQDISLQKQQQSSQQESESSDMLQERKEKEDPIEVEVKFESLASDLTQKSSKGSQISVQGYSLKVLILVFLVSFILGVIVGQRISSPSLQISSSEDQNIQQAKQSANSIKPSIRQALQQKTDDL